jgi:mannosyltransferase
LAEAARTGSAERYLSYILLVGIGLGLVLRFLALGAQSLWVDELLTISNAHIGEPGILSYIAHNLQGPAVSLLAHYWAVLGTSETALRLPFAVAGALTIPAIYLLARDLTDRWTSLHTAFLLALSPIHLWYSQEIRGYAFVVLFSVLSTHFLMVYIRERRASALALYGACLFAGLVSNLSMAFVAVAHLAYLLIRQRRAGLILWWAVAVCVVLVAFSPWVKEIMMRVHPERVVTGEAGVPIIGRSAFPAMALPYSVFTFGFGYTLGPSPRDLQTDRRASLRGNLPQILLGAVALAIPLVVGLLDMARKNRDLLTLLLLMMLVPALAVSLLAAREVKVFNPRYMLVALPAFVMLLGAGAARLTRTRCGVLMLPLLLALGLSLYNYFGNAHYAKDDLREAARTIERGYRDGDVVVGVFTAEPLEFYLDGVAEVHVFSLDDISSPESMAERCRELAEGGDRVWLSLCRQWQVDPDGRIQGWFDSNLERLDEQAFTGVSLLLYGKRGI